MKNIYNLTVLKTLITLSIPTIMEQLLATLLQYVDTAMVGQLGAQATAAISVTTTITWLINSISSAIATATVAMIARSVGAKEYDRIKTLNHLLIKLVIIVGFFLSVGCITLSPFIPIWMGAEENIRHQASLYFTIISIPLIFRTATAIFGAALRGTQDTKTPMRINFASNMINVVLNYFLIYTFDLGVTGAAIGSAIAYTVGGSLMYLAYKKNTLLNQGIADSSQNNTLLKELSSLGIPVLSTNIVSCLGYVVFAGMVSSMGTTLFAAHSIAVTAETIFYIPGYGLRSATSALIGLSYGEGDEKKLKTVGLLSIALTIIMMIISGIVLFLFSYPLMLIFTNSTEVAKIGADMLKIVAFTEPFFGLMVVMEGIFYGLGKTKYVFFVESASMWGIRILFTFFCVKIWNLGLSEVWFCMIADNICKAILLAIPFLFSKYLKLEFIKKTVS